MERPDEPILHADMDAFYASVEQRDNPDLKGQPVVVGGSGNRGVVAAASYEARTFGVRSAMPVVRARRLCPQLVIAPARFDVYADVSSQVMAIFREVTPLVEPLSLDEAFLDVGGARRLLGEPVDIAADLRRRVRDELDLAVSVGVAPSKFLAKLCSGKAKPDGIKHLRVAEVEDYLRPLPVSDLWGAGPKTVERLSDYGFDTVGQIADADLRTLTRVVGDAMGRQLHRLSRGLDERRVVPHDLAKSISAETTFDEDIDDPEQLQRVLLRLAEKVGYRLRRAHLSGRTISIKVRFASFETVTRSTTVALPTDRTRDLVDHAHELLDSLRLERVRVRLLGVGVSNLADAEAASQLSLDVDERWENVDAVADAVRERFAGLSVTSASLLDDDEEVRAPTSDQWQGESGQR